MELHLESAQFRLSELTLKLSCAQLELRRQAFAFQKLAVIAHTVFNADDRPVDDYVEMKIDRQDGAKGRGKTPWEPGQQTKYRRDQGEQDRLDHRKKEAEKQVKSATPPPVFSFDGEVGRQPPDEWGKKSPGKGGRQPDHKIAVPLDLLPLIQKTASILADEEKSEQSPARHIPWPTD
jgi:hypothetical protein